MDKFEKRLQQVNLPKPNSNVKSNDLNRSYAQEFSKLSPLETYDNEVVNLRSQVQILEGKLLFYDREFQIKQQSLEKRIQQLIQTCSQLTQQNTQIKLHYQSLMNEYQQLQEQYNQQEKNAQNYEDRVRNQLENVNKSSQEKEQLILYANKCRERSKQRKQKVKDLTAKLTEMSTQLNDIDKENQGLKSKLDQMLQQYQQQINDLQDQNDEWQLKYTQLVKNVRNITEEENISDISQIQQQQQVTQQAQFDEKDLQKLQEQLEYYDLLQKEITTLVNSLQNCSQAVNINYENQQISQLALIYNRMIEKIVELSEKKKRLKKTNQEQGNQLIQFQLELQRLQQNGRQIQVQQQQQQQQQQPELDYQSKYLFEQRILELEQYYQNEKKSHEKQCKNDRKLQSILKMMTQFIEEFINYTLSLKELNYQLNELQSEPQRKYGSCIKKHVYAIIAVNRLLKLLRQKNSQYIYYKKLKVEIPIITTLHYFLELVGTQQQLIDTMQRAVDSKRPSDSNVLEGDIQQMVDGELREQIRQLQQEMEQNTKHMMEYKTRTDKEIEEKEYQISQLEQECQLLKEQLAQQSNQNLEDQYQEQWNRVKMIENEFLSLNELVEQLQQL